MSRLPTPPYADAGALPTAATPSVVTTEMTRAASSLLQCCRIVPPPYASIRAAANTRVRIAVEWNIHAGRVGSGTTSWVSGRLLVVFDRTLAVCRDVPIVPPHGSAQHPQM
jgi:hypothetical protein